MNWRFTYLRHPSFWVISTVLFNFRVSVGPMLLRCCPITRGSTSVTRIGTICYITFNARRVNSAQTTLLPSVSLGPNADLIILLFFFFLINKSHVLIMAATSDMLTGFPRNIFYCIPIKSLHGTCLIFIDFFIGNIVFSTFFSAFDVTSFGG